MIFGVCGATAVAAAQHLVYRRHDDARVTVAQGGFSSALAAPVPTTVGSGGSGDRTTTGVHGAQWRDHDVNASVTHGSAQETRCQ